MTYAAKARLIKYILPIMIILAFGFIGYSSTHRLFAESSSVAVGVSIFSDQTEYTLGQNVTLTLANASKADVYVANRCPSEPLLVYRQEGNAWVNVVTTANASKCIGEPQDYKIAANTSLKINYEYWPSLFSTAGTYRIVAPIESFDQGPTTTFTIKN